MAIQWNNNVRYDPEKNRVVFIRHDGERSPAERIMEYLEELYPDKPWLEIAVLAVPELKSVTDLSSLSFYSI